MDSGSPRYLYQSNENFDCLPYGGNRRECLWGGHYGRTMSECPVSLHYQTPQQLREKFRIKSRPDEVQLCVPAPTPKWKTRTSTCTCHSDKEARALALLPLPIPVGRLDGWRKHVTEPPSVDELKHAAHGMIRAWAGPEGMKGSDLRTLLEEKFRMSLPVGGRFKFKEWIRNL
jgi:hypothetical protein